MKKEQSCNAEANKLFLYECGKNLCSLTLIVNITFEVMEIF